MALTQKTVDAATHSGGSSWDWLPDDGKRGVGGGFGLRLYPTGHKSYALRYRAAGRLRFYTVGDARHLSLEEARKRARERLTEVADGGDPAADRQRQRRTERCVDLYARYLDEHARLHKTAKSWRDDARRLGFAWDESARRFAPIDYEARPDLKRSALRDRLGTAQLTAVTTADVRALHREVGETRGRYEANRQQELLRSVFYWAQAEGLLPKDHDNPARAATRQDRAGVERFQERARDRYVEPHEVERFAQAVAEEDDWQVKACVWLAVLSGARKRELLSRRWSDVREDQLRVGYDKSGRLSDGSPLPVYKELPEAALEVLYALPSAPLGEDGRLERSENFVFPSPHGSASGHREDIRKPWTRIRRRAGLLVETESDEARSLTFHDLRRTAGSWLASSGYGTRLIGDILGHKDVRTTERYSRVQRSAKREALADSTSRLLAAAKASSGSALVNGELDAEDRKATAARLRADDDGMPQAPERADW